MTLSQDKMKLQEQAFYFSEQRKKSFLNEASKLFAQGMDVEELHEQNLELQILGQGKLVRLVRKDGLQALQFKTKDPQKQSNIEMKIKLHMRSKEKGFSII